MKKPVYIEPKLIGGKSAPLTAARLVILEILAAAEPKMPRKGIDGWHPAWTN